MKSILPDVRRKTSRGERTMSFGNSREATRTAIILVWLVGGVVFMDLRAEAITMTLGSASIRSGAAVTVPLALTPPDGQAAIACRIVSSTPLIAVEDVSVHPGFETFILLDRSDVAGGTNLLFYADPTQPFVTGEIVLDVKLRAAVRLPMATTPYQITLESGSVSDIYGKSAQNLTLEACNLLFLEPTATMLPTSTFTPVPTTVGLPTPTPTEGEDNPLFEASVRWHGLMDGINAEDLLMLLKELKEW
jgi:hypothetical protein